MPVDVNPKRLETPLHCHTEPAEKLRQIIITKIPLIRAYAAHSQYASDRDGRQCM